jgi:hypothetical protein
MNQPILTRDDGEELQMFEGKHVVLLSSESGNYREWEVNINDRRYCVIQEDDDWTLMCFVPEDNIWIDHPGDVDTFLTANHLILAA